MIQIFQIFHLKIILFLKNKLKNIKNNKNLLTNYIKPNKIEENLSQLENETLGSM